MQCPVCENVQLVMSERQGVEIDYCPKCRGVWLDRGELDKLIDKSVASTEQAPVPQQPAARPASVQPPVAPPAYYPQHQPQPYYYKKKRSSLLSEIFDF